jgi:hypothetical protein
MLRAPQLARRCVAGRTCDGGSAQHTTVKQLIVLWLSYAAVVSCCFVVYMLSGSCCLRRELLAVVLSSCVRWCCQSGCGFVGVVSLVAAVLADSFFVLPAVTFFDVVVAAVGVAHHQTTDPIRRIVIHCAWLHAICVGTVAMLRCVRCCCWFFRRIVPAPVDVVN